MSRIGEKMGQVREPEETETEVEQDGQPLHRQYRIFNVEATEGEITELNFSEDSGYFPDYVAERTGPGEELESWEVNTEDNPLEEVSIEPDYDGKYELASKLQEAYEEII